MKNKKVNRIEYYDTTVGTSLCKFSWQTKKVKPQKNTWRWTENKLGLFVEVLADLENIFARNTLEKLTLNNCD